MTLRRRETWGALTVEESRARSDFSSRHCEVCYFYFCGCTAEQNVIRLQIPMDHLHILVQVSQRRCNLTEQILGHLLNVREVLLLLLERATAVLLQVTLDKVEYALGAHVTLLFKVPGRNLSQVRNFEDQVQVVVRVVINHLVKLGNVRMVQLGPYLNLHIDLVQVVYHLHFASSVVADGALSLQRRLMHHFHCELSNFIRVHLGCHSTLVTLQFGRIFLSSFAFLRLLRQFCLSLMC
jgi:hypothetical protein